MEAEQFQVKRCYAREHPVSLLRNLLLHRKQLSVAASYMSCHTAAILGCELLELQKVLLHNLRTVHGRSPVHKVVRLIHKEYIISRLTALCRKEPLEARPRIKDIVIVTYHHVSKQTHIKAQLKRTHPVSLCVPYYHISVNHRLM